jgi:hypothetical protein
MSNQETHRQHFVPQFYLRRFVNSDGKLERFDKKTQYFLVPVSPKSEGFAENYYSEDGKSSDEIGQRIENEFLPPFENLIGSEYAKVLVKLKNRQTLSEGDKEIICLLGAHLFTRGEGMRSVIESMNAQIRPQIERLVPNARKLENFADFFDDTNKTHIGLLPEVRGYYNTFCHKKMRIFRAEGIRGFVTSDSPVSQYAPHERTTPYGFGLFQLVHTFPLSKEYFVELYNPDDLPGKKLIVRSTMDIAVSSRNAHQYNKASSRIYGCSKDDFYNNDET